MGLLDALRLRARERQLTQQVCPNYQWPALASREPSRTARGSLAPFRQAVAQRPRLEAQAIAATLAEAAAGSNPALASRPQAAHSNSVGPRALPTACRAPMFRWKQSFPAAADE
jgi:hypothetical protein